MYSQTFKCVCADIQRNICMYCTVCIYINMFKSLIVQKHIQAYSSENVFISLTLTTSHLNSNFYMPIYTDLHFLFSNLAQVIFYFSPQPKKYLPFSETIQARRLQSEIVKVLKKKRTPTQNSVSYKSVLQKWKYAKKGGTMESYKMHS